MILLVKSPEVKLVKYVKLNKLMNLFQEKVYIELKSSKLRELESSQANEIEIGKLMRNNAQLTLYSLFLIFNTTF